MNERRVFTVGELRELLRGTPDDWEITFGGGLEFCKLEKRGDKHVDLECMQLVVPGRDGKLHIAPKPPARRSDIKKAPSPLAALVRRQAANAARRPG